MTDFWYLIYIGPSIHQILVENFDQFNQSRQLPDYTRDALKRMLLCRTDSLGGHAWKCSNCSHTKVAYNSCKNRSCPQCGWVGVEDWARKTASKLRPRDHFHMIFSIPHELNQLWIRDTKLMIKLFFLAVRQTLVSFSEKHLPGEPGAIMTLHTWSRTLALHPHIHCLFTAGSEDKRGNWHDSGDYLFPIKAVSRYFRIRMLYLVRDYAEELGGKREIQEIIDPLFTKNWNVFITQKYSHGNGVIKYLSNYVRGGPIKNSRIVNYDGVTVTLRYKDHRDNQMKLMSLPVEEFLRRFAMHLVPKRQRVIRALGLYAMKGKGIVELKELLNNSTVKSLYFGQPEFCPTCKSLLILHKNLSYKQIQKYKPPPVLAAA